MKKVEFKELLTTLIECEQEYIISQNLQPHFYFDIGYLQSLQDSDIKTVDVRIYNRINSTMTEVKERGHLVP